MRIKLFFLGITLTLLASCSSDSDITLPRNLQEYIDANASLELDEVIACAATAKGSNTTSHIFYYPISGATDIRYYETDSANVNENDFSIYRRKDLSQQDVFGGKLQRFTKSSEIETWGIVTYVTDGKLHKSNPIRLKNATKMSEYSDTVVIDSTNKTMPVFTWDDGTIKENIIYFQVISDEEDNFISGTYTTEKTFTYYDTSNVVLNINTVTPADLEADKTYNFTLMAVSLDNWVNLIIEKTFETK